MATSAEVTTACSVTTDAVAFGEVALTGATDGTGAVNATCTSGGAYDVGIDDGLNAVAGQRTLVSGANSLNYDLYSDLLHTTRWGAVVGAQQVLTVYGQIASGQALISGNGTQYTDTVQVTVTY